MADCPQRPSRKIDRLEGLPTYVSETGQEYDGATIQDMKIIARAARFGWPMSDAMKTTALVAMTDVLTGPFSASLKLKAIKALAMLNQQTIDLVNAPIVEPAAPDPHQLHLHQHAHQMTPDLSRLNPKELADLRDAADKLLA